MVQGRTQCMEVFLCGLTCFRQHDDVVDTDHLLPMLHAGIHRWLQWSQGHLGTIRSFRPSAIAVDRRILQTSSALFHLAPAAFSFACSSLSCGRTATSTVGPGRRLMTLSETISSTVVRRLVPVSSSLWRTQTSCLPNCAVRPLAPRALGASFFMTRRSGA